MKSDRNPFISSSSRRFLAALALLFWLSPGSLRACERSLSALLGHEQIRDVQRRLDAASRPVDDLAYLRPLPPEIGMVRENLDAFLRDTFFDPLTFGSVPHLVPAYVGRDLPRDTYDFLALPPDDRITCSLVPGTIVRLGDGRQFHFALVFEIDVQKATITVLDPWAEVSFLRRGHNAADIAAEPIVVDGAARKLRLTTQDFVKALDGILWTSLVPPRALVDHLAAVYGERASLPSFAYWTYTTLLLLSAEPAADIVTQLSGDPRRRGDVRFEALATFADEWSAGSSKVSLQRRLRLYATLPPMLQWLYLVRGVFEPREKATAAKTFLEANPADIDLAIERADALRQGGEVAEARTAAAKARTDLEAALMQAVRRPSARAALDYLVSPQSIVLKTYTALRRSHVRLGLLEAKLEAAEQSPDERERRLRDLKRTAADPFDLSYLPDLVELEMRRTNSPITDLTTRALDDLRKETHETRRKLGHEYIALSLYLHLGRTTAIDPHIDVLQNDREGAPIIDLLCRLHFNDQARSADNDLTNCRRL